MEELKCALLGYFGDRITPYGLSPHAAANCDPAQVTFINEAITSVARHVPLVRAFCEANDMGRIEGFVSRSFAFACRDLLDAYEVAVLEKLNDGYDENEEDEDDDDRARLLSTSNAGCSIVELQAAFSAVLSRCADFIRKSTPKEKLTSLLIPQQCSNNDHGDRRSNDNDDDDDRSSTQENDDDNDDSDDEDNPDRIPTTFSCTSKSKHFANKSNNNQHHLSSSASLTIAEKWRRIFHILSEPLLPSPIRASMGLQVHTSLVVNIAHWICYGNIIVDHNHSHSNFINSSNSSSSSSKVRTYSDFFVVQLNTFNNNSNATAGGSSSSSSSSYRTTHGDLAIDEWKIPYGFPMSLCSTILIAGRERRQLELILKQEKEMTSQRWQQQQRRVGGEGGEFERIFLEKKARQDAKKTATMNKQQQLQLQPKVVNDRTPEGDKNNKSTDLRSFVRDGHNRRDRNLDDDGDGDAADDKNANDVDEIPPKRANRDEGASNKNNNNNSDDGDDENETSKWAYRLLFSSPSSSSLSPPSTTGSPFHLISPKTGELAVDELDRRVTRIRNSWARQLWHHVERQGALRQQLHTARDMFLCNRGDLWHTFVERSSPAILGWTFHHQHQSSDAALEVAQQRMMMISQSSVMTSPAIARWVSEAFRNSVSDVRLAESEIHGRFEFLFNNNNNNNNNNSTSQNPSTAAAGTGGGGVMSFDEAGRSMFASIRLIGLKWNLPTALTHVIKPSSLVMYERLFVSNLALKFSVFCLNQCKRFASEAESMSSKAGRQFIHCVQLLHFFLSNVAYSWQVDVQDTHFNAMFDQLDKATSVDEAHRAHAVFVENLTAGAFLAEEGREVARCIGELVVLAFSLFALAREDSTRKTLDAIALAEKRRAPLNPRGLELSATLERVVGTVVKKVASVMSPIASSRRAEHRALWTRLDFNRWFSHQYQRLSAIN